MFALCQGKGSLQALRRRWSTEEGERRNGEEGASEEDKATETAERNTCKQVSAKETALRNVYKNSRKEIFFLFFFF